MKAFRAALLDASQPVPPGLLDGHGAAAGKRFDVYRNNVAVSLTEALQTGFPVLRKLIGPQNFDQLAGLYLRAHPPASPLMMYYGQDMPGFLKKFEPLQHVGYLPDIARLELALRSSYHAADATPVNAETLAAHPPETMGALRITLAPACILLQSPWPIFDIWQFNTVENAPKPKAVAQPILVTRPEFDPIPHALTPASAEFIATLLNGASLEDAVNAAGPPPGPFDLSQILGLLLSQNAITGLTT